MSTPTISNVFSTEQPLIGMLHSPALPGSPNCTGDLRSIRARLLDDVDAIAAGGAHGLLLENFGDAPFFPGRVPTEVVAQMTALACEIKRRCDLPLGINVLRNDGLSALAVAHAAEAEFIRVNILCGARVTDQGIIQGTAHDLLRLRTSLSCKSIRIFADVNVKHSAPLAKRPLQEEVSEIIERGGADAIIVSGSETGTAVDMAELKEVRSASGKVPVIVGSGVTADSLAQLRPYADGFIVGTSIKCDGRVANAVDSARVSELADQLK